MNHEKVTEILGNYQADKSSLIAILQDIQEDYSYLPKDVLIQVSKELNVPLSRVLSLATFFKAFSLVPKGKYPINVCLGTACHVRGGGRVMEKIERELGIPRGGTTADLNFSLDEVRCLGCCGLAPVMTVGKDIHGKLSESKATLILKKYKK